MYVCMYVCKKSRKSILVQTNFKTLLNQYISKVKLKGTK